MKKFLFFPVLLFILSSASALANRTSATITVSDSTVAKGTEVTITINVAHMGNTNAHHTEWVYLKIDGKEVKRWEFERRNLPEDENFKLEYKYTVTGNTEIVVEGSCNLHGSAGPAEKKITVS